MSRLMVSVFDNIFENEEVSMQHVAILGKSGSGKTELLKHIVGSFLQSGKKVIWFDTHGQVQSVCEKWNGYRLSNQKEIKQEILTAYPFILVESVEINFETLQNLLINDKSEWILVHDNIDEVAINYEQNDFSTQKLDFLHFISEFGRVFNLYTVIAGKDIKTLVNVLPCKKIVDNTKNLILLEQNYPSLKAIRKFKWLKEDQIKKVESLLKYEAFYVKK